MPLMPYGAALARLAAAVFAGAANVNKLTVGINRLGAAGLILQGRGKHAHGWDGRPGTNRGRVRRRRKRLHSAARRSSRRRRLLRAA